ncbi:MAG: FtsQ-type POTRA domain-containing protein [Deltaproteobacteria bacterium]|nr:FtsQ-type POTRA domain-containing protein [Deltaproteobacteria bacterium]
MKSYYSRKISNSYRWNRKKRFLKKATVKGAFFVSIKTIGAVFLIAFGVVSVYYLTNGIAHSPYFTLQDVRFQGCTHVSPQELVKLAGLRLGSNIFAVDLTNIAHRVRSNPWVKDVKLERNLPHQLTIKVEEREAVALVSHKRLFLVDDDGILFKEVGPHDPVDLPVITGLSFSCQNADRIQEVLAVLNTAHTLDVIHRDDVSEVHIDANYGLTLYTLKETMPIEMGLGDYCGKLRLLAGVRSDLNERKITPHAIELISSEKAHVRMANAS